MCWLCGIFRITGGKEYKSVRLHIVLHTGHADETDFVIHQTCKYVHDSKMHHADL